MLMRIGAFEVPEPLPQLKEPHALAILRPWVNVGKVGTLVLERLERQFGAQQLGKLARPGTFFDFTRYRPWTRLVAGQRVMTIPNSTISYAKRDEQPDFLFLNLREPHLFGEEYTNSVLEVLTTFGVKRYCLIGGMYDIVPHTRPLLVSGASGGIEVEEESRRVKVQESTYEGPTSITFLITQEARKLGMGHMAFVVHLPQYTQFEEDYAGAACLMELLCQLYQLPSHLVDEERGQQQYGELTNAMERNAEIKAVVEKLEAQYDDREIRQEEPPPLSPEVEKFLRELDQSLGRE